MIDVAIEGQLLFVFANHTKSSTFISQSSKCKRRSLLHLLRGGVRSLLLPQDSAHCDGGRRVPPLQPTPRVFEVEGFKMTQVKHRFSVSSTNPHRLCHRREGPAFFRCLSESAVSEGSVLEGIARRAHPEIDELWHLHICAAIHPLHGCCCATLTEVTMLVTNIICELADLPSLLEFLCHLSTLNKNSILADLIPKIGRWFTGRTLSKNVIKSGQKVRKGGENRGNMKDILNFIYIILVSGGSGMGAEPSD
jgi:hypothetical protein